MMHIPNAMIMEMVRGFVEGFFKGLRGGSEAAAAARSADFVTAASYGCFPGR